MAKAGKSASVAVSFIGKLKTASQMVAIALLLYWQPWSLTSHPRSWATLLIWIWPRCLTLVSMAYYLVMAAMALANRTS